MFLVTFFLSFELVDACMNKRFYGILKRTFKFIKVNYSISNVFKIGYGNPTFKL